jgi:hypothetical protein
LGVSRERLLDILLITNMLVLSLDSCPGQMNMVLQFAFAYLGERRFKRPRLWGF